MTPPDNKNWVHIVFPGHPHGYFTYEIPEKFREAILPGQPVLVPVGKRELTGIAVQFVTDHDIKNIRPILDILDGDPLLNAEMMRLTRWVADYYLTSWGEVIRTALPPGIHRNSRLMITKTVSPDRMPESLSDIQRTILDRLEDGGTSTLQSLEKSLKSRNLRFPLQRLEERGLIHTEQILEEARVSIKWKKWIALARIPEYEELRTIKSKAPRQAEILETLMSSGAEIPRNHLQADMPVLRSLEKKGWITITEREQVRQPVETSGTFEKNQVTLTDEQTAVLSQIDDTLGKDSFHTFLLHGVTSSGKTQVYIEAIGKVLARGKTCLVLIPEISLTPQAVQRYRSAFGDEVAVLHSRMSPGERYDSWRKIRDGSFHIALGPRSAVFAPLKNLGLIIVDEEHETSYKQIDPAPRYNARDVAVMRGAFNHCTVILGSATPSLESYHNCETGKYTLCRMTHRIDGIPLPEVILVDQQESDKEDRVLSILLKEKITARLKKGEQVILMQNRRGYAPFLRCSECGHIESCANCDISLTYHRQDRSLKCHYCGFRITVSDACKNCGGATLIHRGVGTQRVEEELKILFPESRILRMDQDTTRKKNAHHRIISDFENRKGDILIGTQMVAKGHDFPGVNLVGIISADTGLHFPDFRAGEKTFQLLTQTAGRAGRREHRGDVVVQTFSPDSEILAAAARHDFLWFYNRESTARKELNYPPWGRLIMVKLGGAREEKVAQAADLFARQVTRQSFFQMLGPVPSPLTKIKNKYRYQLIFRGSKSADPAGNRLRQTVSDALKKYRERSVFGVRIGVDVDPMDMM